MVDDSYDVWLREIEEADKAEAELDRYERLRAWYFFDGICRSGVCPSCGCAMVYDGDGVMHCAVCNYCVDVTEEFNISEFVFGRWRSFC